MLKPFWQNIFRSNILFGIVMILLVGIPRFIIVLHANITGNYNLVSAIFLFMWIAPFIFLTSEGRREIGMRKPSNYSWLLYSFIAGCVFCAVMFLFAQQLYGNTFSNWFVYISRSYRVAAPALIEQDRIIYFIIYSIVGITFSPVGEELFYRGIVHNSFKSFGERNASVLESLAFSFTHLAHFGIVYISGVWQFLMIPAILWVIFMFVASVIFFLCRQRTGSLVGAILAHAGYNLTMMYFIFFHVMV